MENYIVLYAEDFNSDIWEEYCEICGESPSAISLRIPFNPQKVEAEYEEYDESDGEYEEEDEEE